ncbi:nuclear protein Qri2/Nse4 [Ilyonectria robusta]
MMRPPRRCASPSLAVYLNTPPLALLFGSSFSMTLSIHSTLGTHQFHDLPSRIRTSSIATSSANLDLVSTRATTPPGFHRPASLSTRPKISTARRPYLRLQQRTFSSQSHHAAAMSSQLIPSNPSDVMVIRHVTPNIATFSVPFARVGRIKIGGRGTLGTPAFYSIAPPTTQVSNLHDSEALFRRSRRLFPGGSHRRSQGQGH